MIGRISGKIRRSAVLAGRMVTSTSRRRPDYLILGTERGGTTALHVLLSQHPQVTPPLRKEVHYFDRFFAFGDGWYRSHFPLDRGHAQTGEATANYLYDPRVPARVLRRLPKARFIVLLRDPVERTHSAWKLMTRQGREMRSFEDVITTELESRSTGPLAGLSRKPSPDYLARGEYVDQIARWFDHFPRDRFLILRSEDHLADPEKTFPMVLSFLGLQPWSPFQYPSSHATEPRPLPSSLESLLRAYFLPFNQRLADLIGVEFRWSPDDVPGD